MSEAPKRLFKKLTRENWSTLDPTASHNVWIDDEGNTRPVTPDDWAEEILQVQLSNKVPSELRNLFEVAQGVLCYGAFFYPLYTLGDEQIYRVLDAAVTLVHQKLDGPPGNKNFFKRL